MSEITDKQFIEEYIQESNMYVDTVTSRTVNESNIYEVNYSGVPQNIPIYNNDTPSFRPTPVVTNNNNKPQEKKKSLISKFFSSMSRYGMDYSKDVIDNMRAVPADPKLLPKPEQLLHQDIFSTLSSKWKIKSNEDKNFYEKDLPYKREQLRKLSLQPELEDILDTMTNECIVYDGDNAYFAEPFIEEKSLKDFKKDVKDKIQESIESNFYRLYRMLNWKYNAWDDFKRWLIEGSMAWEIVYDSLSAPKRIVGIIPIDPATLTKAYNNGKIYWVQFKGITGRERKLLDAQVIYIQYQENVVARQSYLERLIRPYNIYRIIEQAQIIWTITNSSYKMKFTIPVKGMNKANGMQTLRSAMQRYKEDIKFNSESGELNINGTTNLPFNKEYWFPETESGSPEVETLGGDGPDLNDNEQMRFFRNELYKISKIPLSRFDYENGTSSFFGTDVTSMARDEINFGRYVNRLRNTFSKVILKPLQIQLALDIPELRDAKEVLDAIQLRYQTYNLFEEMFEQEVMQKRVEFIQSMKDSLVDMDPNGNEVKYFSSEFLVCKYLKMSDADRALNNKYKEKEKAEYNLAGVDDDPDDDPYDDPYHGNRKYYDSKKPKKDKESIIQDTPIDKEESEVIKDDQTIPTPTSDEMEEVKEKPKKKVRKNKKQKEEE